MMSLACRRAAKILLARKSGVSDEDGLWLEGHLAACASCRRDQHGVDALTSLLVEGARPLPMMRRTALVRSALDASAGPPAGRMLPGDSVARDRRAWSAAFALAVGVGLLLVVLWPRDEPTRPVELVQPAPSSEPPATRAREVGPERTRDAFSEGSRYTWLADDRLRLDTGDVALDPRDDLLRVEAPSFAVALEPAAQAWVDASGTVRVLAGRVTIEADAERVELAAGASWRLAPADAKADSDTDTPRAKRKATKSRRSPLVADVIVKTRAKIAERRGQEARALAARGLNAAKISAANKAELRMLVAESWRIDGDTARSAALYERLALELPEPHRETALYSAARLRADRGEPKRARTLLKRYIHEYPDGVFSEEAAKHLGDAGL